MTDREKDIALREAAHIASPEVKQEPVAWLSVDCIGERYLCFSKPVDNDPVTPLYTYPPDAQAEIAKLDKRIKELEEVDDLLCSDCMDTGWLENRVEGKYPCTCVSETEPYQILVQQNSEQAAEIARLKAVIGECKEVLEDCHQNINQERGFASEIERDIEQTLAAIKEIDHER